LKILYGSGQAVDATIQVAVNTFLLFYLTAVCGMSGSAAGSVFLLSLVIDALLDPFIGRMSDNWNSRWGRRLPFMAAAVIPMAVSVLLMFSLPRQLSGIALFAYVLGLNVSLRVSLSVFALPHSALTAELTHDYAERSVVSAYRAVFIVIGTAAAMAPPFLFIFNDPDGLQSRGAYPWLGAWFAVLVTGFGIVCLLGIARRVLSLDSSQRGAAQGHIGFFADLLQLFRNPSFVPLLVGAVLVLIGQGAASALNLHAYRFFWKLPSALIQLPLLVIPIGMVIGTFAANLLLKRIEKREGVVVAVAITAVFPSALTVAALVGLVSPGSPLSIGLVVVNGMLFGACGVTSFICFFSMLADAVDEHDLLYGVRREALYTAALMIGAKAASGIGAFLAGSGLQLIGFAAVPAATGAVSVSAETVVGLGVLWGPGAALVILSSIPFLRRYRVDRAHHAVILAALASRKDAT
jgi:GPH family glycoside/pentoside/hexuronide:cation symporter